MPAASLTMYRSRTMKAASLPQPAPAKAQMPEAVAAAFQAHASRMLGAALRITGDLQDAEDVLQGVFIRLLQRPDGKAILDGPEAGPYLHRAAVNAALDLLRAKARRPVRGLDPQAPAPCEGAEQGLAREDLADRLRQGLSQLSPRAAEMVTLRYLEGYSNQEVAALTGSSESTVAVTLFRARQTLRQELGAEGEQR